LLATGLGALDAGNYQYLSNRYCTPASAEEEIPTPAKLVKFAIRTRQITLE